MPASAQVPTVPCADAMKTMIRALILQILGRPERFQRVQVHQLWDNHYRANVLVGSDAVQVTIARSYFLVFDAAGNMVSSTPDIARAA
jgi:hypothetical protein